MRWFEPVAIAPLCPGAPMLWHDLLMTDSGRANHYRIGLPAWAFPGWQGRYFHNRPSSLSSYAQVFNTVEGNTTFYQIPSTQMVEGWRQALADTDLQICFKLPRTVTHDRVSNLADLDTFFDRIAPLGDHIGPVLLQFPATVGAAKLDILERLFSLLPPQYRYVVEVRHADFFDRPQALEPLLAQYGFGRVMMDTRPVFQGDRHHREVRAAIHSKPDLPVLEGVYNRLVFVRLLLHPDLTSNGLYIEQWVNRLQQALTQGWDCYMMIHCPNNLHCPALALSFHEALRKRLGADKLAALPPWPVPQQVQLL